MIYPRAFVKYRAGFLVTFFKVYFLVTYLDVFSYVSSSFAIKPISKVPPYKLTFNECGLFELVT